MNEFFDFTKDAQKFFKDKIHALNNAISHENDPEKISKLKVQLRYAQKDWEKYLELQKTLLDSRKEKSAYTNSGKIILYCKNHFWLL